MKVSRTNRMTILAAAALVVACARVRTDESAPANSAPARGRDAPPAGGQERRTTPGQGPVQVPGTTVAATDVDSGAALVFTTRTGDVTELRRRARDMAEMHNERLAARPTGRGGPGAGGRQHHGGGHGGMMGGGGMMMMMPPATASVEDVENGARIVFRPEDPAQLEALREAVRMRAERMASGACPMMSLDEPEAAPETKPPSSDAK